MKKNVKIEIASGIIMAMALAIGGSIWLGNHRPQNIWQYAVSFSGISKPQADAPSRVVFLGDSITAKEDWNVLFGISYIYNTGISGNTTDDIIPRLSAAISSKPQKLFLMMGINDLIQGKDASYAAKNYEAILDRIKIESPDTEIYIQSTLPINSDILKYGKVDSRKIIDLNGKLKALADGKKIFFIDLYPYFCGPDNKLYAKYTSDGLHPNSHGYAVWKNLVSQYVN